MIRVLLCRHGETDWNRDHRLQGRSDISLASSGERQASITGGFVRAQNPQQGHVSSLVRTQQTFAQFNLDLQPRVWDELMEQNLGEWEGSYAAEIRDREPEEFSAWRAGTYTPAGGETHQQLAERMLSVFCGVVRETAQIRPTASPDLSFAVRTAVVVSHGAALRVLLEHLDLIDRAQSIPLTPASATVVDVPLTLGPVSSSLPRSGLDDALTPEDEAAHIAGLTDEQIIAQSRLRVLNLSPELLNPSATQSVSV
ncbi:histidine phosphatase family protein [Nesterenkonia xinjiangensis]|uniref:Putative phosphoglycerate mutase n=1 Tax=Nesterenkonia xinjiangensis TaxID=225327 RepID=A0A7Z0GJ05_9MICC|nr:histidine phosphatase family protein [Nesterenkonia xinjiangensis]NYJ76875.1 putative phosphoglycerate mutase [Nesterenkonia xinjiangensis]